MNKKRDCLEPSFQIFQNLSELVFVVNQQGNIEFWNLQAEKIFAVSAKGALGKPFHKITKLKLGDADTADTNDVLAHVEKFDSWIGEVIHNVDKNDSVTLKISISKYWLDASKKYRYLIIGKPVENGNTQLVYYQEKMQAIGRLAGGLAHDINNLMAGVTGNASLAILDIEESHPSYDPLQEIMVASDRTTDLTRKLLTFSCRQFVALECFSINALINSMKVELLKILGKNCKLSFEFSEEAFINADKKQIKRVVLDLVKNSNDAMQSSKNSELVLKIYKDDGRKDCIRKASENGVKEFVVIEVIDNGCGMDQEIRKKMFEPFFSTKPKGCGKGFGLASVWGMVKKNNGYVFVNSETDKGTSIKLYWPSCKGDLLPKIKIKKNKDTTGKLPLGAETILMVDDEDTVRAMNVKILSRYGYNVIDAFDGVDALSKYNDIEGNIDLLMTDVIMPNMDGGELAKCLTKKKPKLKVLFNSGFSDNSFVNELIGKNVDFLEKPFRPDSLAKKVREILDR